MLCHCISTSSNALVQSGPNSASFVWLLNLACTHAPVWLRQLEELQQERWKLELYGELEVGAGTSRSPCTFFCMSLP